MLELSILYLISNVVAVDYSYSLTEKEIYKLIIDMGNKGYKLDSEKVYNLKTSGNSENQNILSNLIILIPGLNIIKTKNDLEKLKQNIKDTIKDNDVLIEMTDEEKMLYSTIKTDKVKLLYLSMLSKNNCESNNKRMIKTYGRN